MAMTYLVIANLFNLRASPYTPSHAHNYCVTHLTHLTFVTSLLKLNFLCLRVKFTCFKVLGTYLQNLVFKVSPSTNYIFQFSGCPVAPLQESKLDLGLTYSLQSAIEMKL
jgi:hypothetical protein